MSKKAVIVVTKPPYGTAVMAEAFRTAMGIPTVNIETNVVLEGDAVFAILKSAKPKENLNFGNMGEAFMMYEEFGFTLFVHKPSVELRKLKFEDLMKCKSLTEEELQDLLRESDVILRF
jgi:sulfur relay (sulfurtransferase) DsrF/TusC family protein